MDEESATPDLMLSRIAAEQHGVATADQISGIGISKDGVYKRVRSGSLHRVHRGVYAIGHPRLTAEARWMAAVLACGKDAVLSHHAAAALWGFGPATSGPVDITVAGTSGRRKRPGIRLHRSKTVRPEHTTRRAGIAVTTPARTIADLRRVLSPALLRKATRQAEALGFETWENFRESTRSELEDRFRSLCRNFGLPTPEVNVRVGAFTVDFLWRERRLIVETDGYRYHRGRQAFEDDRDRDLKLKMLGFDVIRLTHRQLVADPAGIASALRSVLHR